MKIDIFNLSLTTPTLTQLQTYDSVLVYTDFGQLNNPTALGNNLADYVDGGGGVVVAVFANASIPFGGRFNSDNYWGIIPASQTQGTRLTLGTIYDPTNPILNGVNSFDGRFNSFRSTGAVHPDATRVADWSDGSPLVVTRTIGIAQRVDLNFFPPSSDAESDFWDSSTDGAQLMANALTNAAAGAPGGGAMPHAAPHDLLMGVPGAAQASGPALPAAGVSSGSGSGLESTSAVSAPWFMTPAAAMTPGTPATPSGQPGTAVVDSVFSAAGLNDPFAPGGPAAAFHSMAV